MGETSVEGKRYLDILGEHARRTNLRILGWCLMTDHVHLIAIPGTAESMWLALGEGNSRYTLELTLRLSSSGPGADGEAAATGWA